MRNNGYGIALLYGRSNGNGARTSANAVAFVLSVVQLAVNELAVMSGYVDVVGAELAQTVDGTKQLCRAVAFEWWQHLERNGLGCCLFI